MRFPVSWCTPGLLLLILATTTRAQQRCSDAEVVADDCPTTNDGVCDQGNRLDCPVGTDCFDCDPCAAFSGTSCTECQAAGCAWCPDPDPTRQWCTSPTLAILQPDTCLVLYPGYVVDACPTCDYSSGSISDSCPFFWDQICDEVFYPTFGDTLCGQNTDCFDCDPCHAFDNTSCEACTANENCVWCSRDAFCTSANLALVASTVRTRSGRPVDFTCAPEDYALNSAECPTLENDNVYGDPLYDANRWIFDLIDVEAVWRAGISK
jgi:hypothetical protein